MLARDLDAPARRRGSRHRDKSAAAARGECRQRRCRSCLRRKLLRAADDRQESAQCQHCRQRSSASRSSASASRTAPSRTMQVARIKAAARRPRSARAPCRSSIAAMPSKGGSPVRRLSRARSNDGSRLLGSSIHVAPHRPAARAARGARRASSGRHDPGDAGKQGRRRHAGQAAPLAAQRAHRLPSRAGRHAYARSAPGRCRPRPQPRQQEEAGIPGGRRRPVAGLGRGLRLIRWRVSSWAAQGADRQRLGACCEPGRRPWGRCDGDRRRGTRCGQPSPRSR